MSIARLGVFSGTFGATATDPSVQESSCDGALRFSTGIFIVSLQAMACFYRGRCHHCGMTHPKQRKHKQVHQDPVLGILERGTRLSSPEGADFMTPSKGHAASGVKALWGQGCQAAPAGQPQAKNLEQRLLWDPCGKC